MKSLIAVFLTLISVSNALILPNGAGRLPALGWNSWNSFGCDINETVFLSAAESIVSLGFKDAGYEYVNVDDCWSVKSGRDNATQQIIPDTRKFPDGISGLAAKVHDLGLKFGIYSSAGTETCAGYPASLGYESIDAASFAAWGIDYLKYDNCYVPDNWTDICSACVYAESVPENYVNGTCVNTTGICPTGYDYSKSNTAERYRLMRDALLAQNRTILFSLCDWGNADVEQWGNATGNSWRMSYDIKANFTWVLSILNMNSFQLNSVDFWGHNDADMLEIGNGDLTEAEARTHFAFWAAMKSPLILGTDLDALSRTSIDVLQNKYLLAFNQDPDYGVPATPYKWGVNPDWTFNATNPAEYWSGASTNGILVLLLNTLEKPRRMTADFREIPGLRAGREHKVIDAWTGEDLGPRRKGITATVESHDTAVFLVQKL